MRRIVSLLAALTCATTLGTGLSTAAAAAPARSWVVEAQRTLNHLGCDSGRPDGRVDRQVRAAAVRFQAASGTPQSGHLTSDTRRRLRADDAPRCDRRPVPAGSGRGRRVVVSQAQNWLWLVGPRGRTLAQGGMIDNTRELRPGSYTTGSYCGRAARIARNSDYSGRLWLDDFVRFAPCGIGFHRIPRYKSTGRQIHADWLLGTDLAASHGCLRLSAVMAGKVWRFTARRTVVRVL
ncbi:L,D-transpeptidase family protein [Nocardioides mangrovi]|uniref:L,D-transpeptidase family protein n=1 Tax=Nocardioides mangrovi TaxID=2874580 RepID=A0ABS7UCL7_9ACTN|nr:L,D-transpeptidase family protein [Nocardioides mangrovi]MBZ5738738.1 L,D-transpeptidase family protein [Nocardioides mangrovi]